MRVRADFNEVYEDDLIWISLRRVAPFDAACIVRDETVELYDEDGNACLAVVTERRDRTAICAIRWETWRPAVRGTLHPYGDELDNEQRVTGAMQVA